MCDLSRFLFGVVMAGSGLVFFVVGWLLGALYAGEKKVKGG